MSLLAGIRKSFASYFWRHPILSLEHAALILLFLLWRFESAMRIHDRPTFPKPGRASSTDRLAAFGDGPLDAFTRVGISEAPMPSMANRELGAFGKMIHYNDSRGDITRFSLGSGRIVNLMRTRKGTMRSGDLHNCTQYDVILRGHTKLRLKDLRTQREVVREYSGDNDFIAIQPRVPHIFEFMEDNVMIEWWDCDFRAWHYMPYRKLIEELLNLKSA